LWLNDNQIIKIEGLDKLVELRELLLKNNQIIKIENVDKFTKLEELWLSHTYVFKLNLFDIKNIQHTYFDKTLI
jgi:Leucine-rich repeat (LRR) protein